MNDAAAQELLSGKDKPIGISISTNDIQALFACRTSPDAYNQLLLAKLKDGGAPVEGALRLRLAHGQVFKMKTDPTKPQEAFEYLWMPESYVAAIAIGAQAC